MESILWHAYKMGYGEGSKITNQYQDCVVALLCAQPGDDGKIERIVNGTLDYHASRGSPKRSLVLFPFAHVSANVAPPGQAQEVLDAIFERIKGKGVDVHMAPFGTDKRINLETIAGSDAYRNY